MLGEKDMNKESRKLRIRYSPDADILLISINNEKPEYGEEMLNQIIIHYNKDNKPIEIEILNATEILTKIIKVMLKTKKEEIAITK